MISRLVETLQLFQKNWRVKNDGEIHQKSQRKLEFRFKNINNNF